MNRFSLSVAAGLALVGPTIGAEPEDIAFTAEIDGTGQLYVEVLPPNFDPDKPTDAIVALHGHGSDRWQFVRQGRAECRAVRDVAAKRGMILISPDYRAPASWMGPGAEADLVQIIADVRKRRRVRRVFLTGASMGGASCLTFAALHPELVHGVASMNGTANHVDYDRFQDAIQASFGGMKAEIPDEYRKRSAEFWPHRFTMPVAFAVGGQDQSVPPHSVLRLAEKLRIDGRRVHLIHRENGGHSTNYEDAAAILKFAIDRADSPADLKPLRIADPVGGHIHPAICVSGDGTIVVTYGRVNHRDLRITRSADGGKTWSEPAPFVHTIAKTYYPGSLTALSDGRIVHCWNRWDTDTTEKEPRSVLLSISDDDGATWGEPIPLPRDPAIRSIIRHPFVELEPNRWLFSLCGRTFIFDPRTGEAEDFGQGQIHTKIPVVRTPKGTFVSGGGLRSTDGGATWTEIAEFPNILEQWWRHELICLSNGWLLASEILGPGTGGERIRYVISRDDGLTWSHRFEFYNPGRAIGGRACPRTIELDENTIGVVFYDVSQAQDGGPGLFWLRIPLETLR